MPLLAVLLTMSVAAGQVAANQVMPCLARDRQEPRLRPRDGAARDPDFLAFRQQLRSIVERRDTAALVALLHPDIKVDFGGGAGVDAFRLAHLGGIGESFWPEFAQILRWGGSFTGPVLFAAPYVYSDWPDELDAFECAAVVGTRVRLRSSPQITAPVLALLEHSIVQTVAPDPLALARPGWRHVRTYDGRLGYIAERYVRSPIAHRALFEFSDGRWWLTAYVAGD